LTPRGATLGQLLQSSIFARDFVLCYKQTILSSHYLWLNCLVMKSKKSTFYYFFGILLHILNEKFKTKINIEWYHNPSNVSCCVKIHLDTHNSILINHKRSFQSLSCCKLLFVNVKMMIYQYGLNSNTQFKQTYRLLMMVVK